MLQKLKPADFDKVFHIMELSFPKDEFRTYEEQKALLEKSYYQIYILPNESGEDIKAFVAVWEFDEIVYIEHLAVNPEFRNGGLGALILQELIRQSDKQICLEVEPPKETMAIRRIGFYERNGFFLNEYDYMQPAISKGRKPIPLMIMTSDKKICREEFDRIKKLLYTKVYGQKGE